MTGLRHDYKREIAGLTEETTIFPRVVVERVEPLVNGTGLSVKVFLLVTKVDLFHPLDGLPSTFGQIKFANIDTNLHSSFKQWCVDPSRIIYSICDNVANNIIFIHEWVNLSDVKILLQLG